MVVATGATVGLPAGEVTTAPIDDGATVVVAAAVVRRSTNMAAVAERLMMNDGDDAVSWSWNQGRAYKHAAWIGSKQREYRTQAYKHAVTLDPQRLPSGFKGGVLGARVCGVGVDGRWPTSVAVLFATASSKKNLLQFCFFFLSAACAGASALRPAERLSVSDVNLAPRCPWLS